MERNEIIYVPLSLIQNTKSRIRGEKNPEYIQLYKNYIKILSFSLDINPNQEEQRMFIGLSQRMDYFHMRTNEKKLDQSSKDIVFFDTQNAIKEVQEYLKEKYNFTSNYLTNEDRKKIQTIEYQRLITDLTRIILEIKEYRNKDYSKDFPKFLIEDNHRRYDIVIDTFNRFIKIISEVIQSIRRLDVMTQTDYEECNMLLQEFKKMVKIINKNYHKLDMHISNQDIMSILEMINEYYRLIIGEEPTNSSNKKRNML